MSNNPCFQVPSPAEITTNLFSNPSPNPPPVFPEQWTATALLTPFGGLNASSPLSSSDELVVARISYNAATSSLRTQLYLLESLLYYDLAFVSSGAETVWYWLVTDPASPFPEPSEVFGPYPTSTQVLAPTFLGDAGFSYVGTWNVVNQPCDGYSAGGTTKGTTAGTWFSFFSQTNELSRIMNVDNTNDFKIPVLGAYYLVNFATFAAAAPSIDFESIDRLADDDASSGEAPSPMLTLQDIQNTMANPPSGASQVSCTPQDIEAVIPGISFPQSQPTPPAWTNQMQTFCYMMGQDTYPYYCQVYYDYTVNKTQISVFVTTDPTLGTDPYNSRQDMVLPRGTVGPALNYEFGEGTAQWAAVCYSPGGGVVPMSVPNFVEAGGGRCRAVIKNNPYFGPEDIITIWSVMLGDQSNWADFWYWFNSEQQGVVFSLAPASSLTMIDYQTFVQNPSLPACTFDEPTTGLPTCPSAVAERPQKLAFTPKGGFARP